MKQLNLKTYQNIIKAEPYTYNSFNDDIRDFDKYIDYLNENFKKLDFTMVDKFVEYIYSIVDSVDYLFIEYLDETKELELYKKNLKYTYYDKIIIEGAEESKFFTKYLFDIRDNKSKSFVKNNIKFNLSDEYREPMIVETDRKYILNVDSSRNGIFEENGKTILRIEDFFCNYCFVKDGFLQLILYQNDGYIYDYRDIEELYFLKRKDLKVKNNNYISYDYTKFSNDINDNKYINYIYDIIDDVDYFFMSRFDYYNYGKFLKKLNYTYYDKILLENKSRDFGTNYIFDIKIFDIKNKNSKQILKDIIKFNLSDNDRKPILVDSNKKYILNEIDKKYYCYIDYYFVKDDYLEIILHQQDGYIYDYRDIDIREREIKKYK